MRRRVEAARDIELLWPDGLGTILAIASRRALAFLRGVARPVLSTPQCSAPRGRHAKREMDAAVVAGWLVGQFPAGRYNGLVEGLRRFGSVHGHAVRQVLYRHPDVFSGAVADLYRQWLRGGDRTGNRLVVECGRLLDGWHVVRVWCRTGASIRCAPRPARCPGDWPAASRSPRSTCCPSRPGCRCRPWRT